MPALETVVINRPTGGSEETEEEERGDEEEGGSTIGIFFLDTETTDRATSTARVVEVAALNAGTGDTWRSLVKPIGEDGRQEESAPEALKKHGYGTEALKDQDTFEVVGSELVDWISSFHNKINVLIGHNVSFDERVLRAEFKRNGQKVPSGWLFFDSVPFGKRLI